VIDTEAGEINTKKLAEAGKITGIDALDISLSAVRNT